MAAVIAQATRRGVAPRDYGIRFDKIVFRLVGWLVGGIILDQVAHYMKWVSDAEGFFTPWHYVLYTGGFSLCAWIVWPLIRNSTLPLIQNRIPMAIRQRVPLLREPIEFVPFKAAVPQGYLWSVYGVILFVIGFFYDAIWHTAFGIEVGLEAGLSPAHLLLFTAILLIISGPARAMCLRLTPGTRLTWRQHWPGLLSVISVVFLVYALMFYANSIVMVPRWDTQGPALSTGLQLTPEEQATIAEHPRILNAIRLFSFMPATLAIAMTSIVLVSIMLTVGRRYILPRGFWVMLFLFMSPYSILYRQSWIIPLAIGLGVAVEILLHVLDYRRDETRGRWATILVPMLVQFGLILTSTTTGWWSFHISSGTPFIAALVGGLAGLVIWKPNFLQGNFEVLPEETQTTQQ